MSEEASIRHIPTRTFDVKIFYLENIIENIYANKHLFPDLENKEFDFFENSFSRKDKIPMIEPISFDCAANLIKMIDNGVMVEETND